MVVANLTVAEQIGELLVHCTYGCRHKNDVTKPELTNQDSAISPIVYEVIPDGCPVTVKIKERRWVAFVE